MHCVDFSPAVFERGECFNIYCICCVEYTHIGLFYDGAIKSKLGHLRPGFSRTVLYFRDLSWNKLCPGFDIL